MVVGFEFGDSGGDQAGRTSRASMQNLMRSAIDTLGCHNKYRLRIILTLKKSLDDIGLQNVSRSPTITTAGESESGRKKLKAGEILEFNRG
jgi:hypothetical protein